MLTRCQGHESPIATTGPWPSDAVTDNTGRVRAGTLSVVPFWRTGKTMRWSAIQVMLTRMLHRTKSNFFTPDTSSTPQEGGANLNRGAAFRAAEEYMYGAGRALSLICLLLLVPKADAQTGPASGDATHTAGEKPPVPPEQPTPSSPSMSQHRRRSSQLHLHRWNLLRKIFRQYSQT